MSKPDSHQDFDSLLKVEAEVEAKLGGPNRSRFDRVQAIIDMVEAKPFHFRLTWAGLEGFILRTLLWRQDTNTGEWGWGEGGLHYIPADSSEDAIVKRCFVAARDYAEHEVREAFHYKGRRVLDPHQSIQDLWEISR